MIGRTLCHYEVEARLGKGGMGEVYLAKDLKLGRRVALKVLPAELADDPGRLAQLEREARNLAALDHPNIVTVFSVEEAEGLRFLTMAHVEGRTLAEMIPPHGLPLDRLLGLAVQLAEALRAAHERGIVHRDLKPGNVMVDKEGRVQVLDFGLAKRGLTGAYATDTQVPTETVTAEGTVLGTYPYMSPEQAEGKTVDPRTDVFSLGVILYEMAVGKRPFQGDSAVSVLSSILKDTPAPVSELRADLPRHLSRVIDHCLAKNPERRYQSAQDIRNELEALEKELEIESAVSASSARPSSERPRRWIAAATIAGVLLLAGFGYWAANRAGLSVSAHDETRIASIVALPSEVFGGTGEEFLTDAIPLSLSTHLVELPGLETKAPPTRLDLERIEGDLDRIAGLYGVDTWLRSSIAAEPDRFVLNVQLVDVASRSLLWSDEFEGARGAYIDLVREAAAAVAGWLRPAHSLPLPTSGTAGSEAELALRRGQFFANRYNNSHRPPDFDSAFEAFEELLRIHPDSAEAAAELSRLHVYRFEAGEVAALAEIERWGKRAVAADPTSSLAWSTRASGQIYGGFRDLEAALEFGLRAGAFGHENARAHNTLGLVLDFGGLSMELALEAYRKAASIDPLYAYPHSNAGSTLLSYGRIEEALPFFDSALRIRPDDRWSRLSKWVALSELGWVGEASSAWGQLLEMEGEGGAAVFLGQVLEDLSRPGEVSEEAARRLRGLLNGSLLSEYQVTQVAQGSYPWIANLGAAELAFEFIDLSTAGGRAPPYDFLEASPLLDPIREDPRFDVILTEARNRFDLMLGLVDTARQRGEVPPYLEAPLVDLLARLEDAGSVEAAE